MNDATVRSRPSAIPEARAEEDGFSLPAWIYHDPEFFEVERQTVFRTSWQLVCHQNDIPDPGDYHCLDFLGEPVVVLRGEDGEPRSFYNVCRHRASRLLDGQRGHCGRRITCPYSRRPKRSSAKLRMSMRIPAVKCARCAI